MYISEPVVTPLLQGIGMGNILQDFAKRMSDTTSQHMQDVWDWINAQQISSFNSSELFLRPTSWPLYSRPHVYKGFDSVEIMSTISASLAALQNKNRAAQPCLLSPLRIVVAKMTQVCQMPYKAS
jgi:hypothetical protein